MGSLRELDKAAEASRSVRGEGFIPEERLALHEAMKEIEQTLMLETEDHMLWNFKSAWLYLLDKQEEAIAAADMALSICPTGYIKPLTNKALALHRLGRNEQSRLVASQALKDAQALGSEGRADVELAKRILDDLARTALSDTTLLSAIAERIITAVNLTARQEMTQWKGENDGAELLKGLKKRVSIAGRSWNTQYNNIMAELLTFFCPESGWTIVIKLGGSHQEEYQHCLHAVLFIAAHADGVMRRDACRFLIYQMLAASNPDEMRKSYREAILGPTAVGQGAFSRLDQFMRNEMARVNPALPKLLADQPPMTEAELNRSRDVTMSRFLNGSGSHDMVRCRKCRGTGRVKADVTGVSWYSAECPCPRCGGTGFVKYNLSRSQMIWRVLLLFLVVDAIGFALTIWLFHTTEVQTIILTIMAVAFFVWFAIRTLSNPSLDD